MALRLYGTTAQRHSGLKNSKGERERGRKGERGKGERERGRMIESSIRSS